jgi:hypothetical protein
MAKRLTPEEKAQRLAEKNERIQRRIQAKKKREKEIRYKRWLISERARIRNKNAHYAEIKRLNKKNVLYEQELKKLIDLTLGLDVMPIQNDIAYPFYRFFFPYKMATPNGKLNPIEGFSTEVALRYIDTFIKAGHHYGHRYSDIYNIFCNHRITGAEFIKAYNMGVNSYKLLFSGAPAELLYRLYNVRVPGSTARGAGEYLLCLKISDVVKGKNGDICTKSGVCIEAKAFDGRLDCQIPSNVKAMGEFMLGDGMIKEYNSAKKHNWSTQDIIKHFALNKIQTYKQFLSQEQMDLFVKNMTENWDAFLINGEFTEESINRINGCHDAYVYPLLERFSHLKVDSNQPTRIENAKDFDVHFKIFNREEFATPGLILRLIENNYIRFYGFIKNDGRDKAVHVGI